MFNNRIPEELSGTAGYFTRLFLHILTWGGMVAGITTAGIADMAVTIEDIINYLTHHTNADMYFYIHKINKNEIQQNILLEMCRNACIYYGSGESIYGISQITQSN